ncbi:hypothetical protein TNCV_2069951 [Trichonephila clavipes]|uniref:Uncharacterized protein n=1 Tax=Trichonephila clavipes TaxID=2585209 RepID=A0A8X7BD85_TRICX|nr:hypothetical protein TNCV_2069951 [Trichonephila clavipes]
MVELIVQTLFPPGARYICLASKFSRWHGVDVKNEMPLQVFISLSNSGTKLQGVMDCCQLVQEDREGPILDVRSNSWDAQLAIPNDPRYAQLETNLGIGQFKEE